MGSYGPPLIGYSLNALVDPLGFSRELFQREGDIAWFGVLGRKVVGFGSPELTEQLLLDRNHDFSAKGGYGFLIGPFFKDGLLLRDFDDHIYHRRIMQKAFTRPRLEGYLALANPRIEQAVRNWQPNASFNVFPEVKTVLLDIAAEVFMGTELGPEATRLKDAFEDAVHGGQAMIRADVPGGIWARGLAGRRLLEKYFRRDMPAKRAGTGTDLFSALCHIQSDEGHTFTDDDVVDHMIFLMMAAHDTTTVTTTMVLYHLAKYPEWQDRLRAESQALGKQTLDFDDLSQLPSLELVFKETLRLYAPVGQHARQAVRDTEIGGRFIPKGTIVIASPYAGMRMAPWIDPDEFDPERFTEERHEDDAHRFAWAPFGGGAHKCIGQYFGGLQVKSIVHQLLLDFRVSIADGYEPELGWATGPTPIDGMPVRLERLES
ncbi:cytochrome P450 [Smaragdicoccus niigatensis]|uniref:cytochrome P450 n=1 Tax=Smaragdicoccus niigatensis TaxID=359359 RepID=UPI0003755B18|nr:cytochrome P450 [Smaragdicoccus niigatensis]